MSRKLKGFRGLHFSLTKMHKSSALFTGLSPAKQQAWAAFDRKNSARRARHGGGGGGHSLI